MRFLQEMLDRKRIRCHANLSYDKFLMIFKKKKTNNKNEFKFGLYIEKKVFSYFLVKKYDFVNNKIIEIYNE